MELFKVNHHLKELYDDGELQPEATVRNCRIVQKVDWAGLELKYWGIGGIVIR
jgi:hypothetical protein